MKRSHYKVLFMHVWVGVAYTCLILIALKSPVQTSTWCTPNLKRTTGSPVMPWLFTREPYRVLELKKSEWTFAFWLFWPKLFYVYPEVSTSFKFLSWTIWRNSFLNRFSSVIRLCCGNYFYSNVLMKCSNWTCPLLDMRFSTFTLEESPSRSVSHTPVLFTRFVFTLFYYESMFCGLKHVLFLQLCCSNQYYCAVLDYS